MNSGLIEPILNLRGALFPIQQAVCQNLHRAADLLPVAGVGAVVTARFGDAPPSPPWSRTKSFAAAPDAVFKKALLSFGGVLARLQVALDMRPRQSLAKKTKILTPHRYIISVKALGDRRWRWRRGINRVLRQLWQGVYIVRN